MCSGWCNNWVTRQRARCNNKNSYSSEFSGFRLCVCVCVSVCSVCSSTFAVFGCPIVSIDMTLFCAPGPKPLKRFTPPPDYTRDSGSSEEDTESEEEEEEDEEEEDADPNIVRSSDKFEDEFLKQVCLVRRWHHCARFDILTVVLVKIQVLWDVAPCYLASSSLLGVNNVLIRTVFTQQYKYQLQIITTIQQSNIFRPYSAIIRLTKDWS